MSFTEAARMAALPGSLTCNLAMEQVVVTAAGAIAFRPQSDDALASD